jgi:hypothetical protein
MASPGRWPCIGFREAADALAPWEGGQLQVKRKSSDSGGVIVMSAMVRLGPDGAGLARADCQSELWSNWLTSSAISRQFDPAAQRIEDQAAADSFDI